ncbi:hypothetical protein EJP77_10945 [Paenibacillus zeisoli]|uniref:Uncharacterized protein n=1 Tax=Paenibacillus zeisoli TaxID=2496267 RepID=A0A433XCU0_9BACL|nr:DUF6138 family protein [Paenibacillus zeisoli]RUT31886.1 hypothetical protein EJP77_10945 [Paenibacillus zeisoli]
MSEAVELFLNEVWNEVMAIYAKENRSMGQVKNRSRLQAGIRDYLRVAWRKGKFSWAEGHIHIDVSEPFSWSDSSYQIEAGSYIVELTDEQLTEEWFPALCGRVEELLHSEEFGAHFFDYRLDVVFIFERENSTIDLQRRLVNESKLAELRKSLDHFIQSKIMSDLPVLPGDHDLFFFAQHLVNPDLMSQGEKGIDPLLRQLAGKLHNFPKRRDAWSRQCASAFRQWAQDYFLPQYFERAEDYGHDWTLKGEPDLAGVDPAEVDFFLYAALQIGLTEPDTRQKYLELAVLLGSKRAQDYLQIGSGKFNSTYAGERMEGKNNDVTQTIEIGILSEEEQAYGEALDYITGLLRQGFPKGYQLKLKSSQKHFLPVKKLAKSKLHQFFANALSYPSLYPKLAEYADTAMEEFAWYGDVEPGEKSVMPGTYAVMGLGLCSEAYFPLVCRYMELVDTEHQMVQDGYAEVFIDAHGVQAEHMPVIVSILLGGNEEGRQVKNIAIDRPELADALVQALKDKADHQAHLVLSRIFGSPKKLAGAVRQAQSPLREGLEELLGVWG